MVTRWLRRLFVPLGSRSALGRGTRPRRGVMLILTLWLAVVLGILATSLTSHLIMQTRLMSMRRHRLGAEALARAGVGRAIADLRNDLILDTSERAENFDGEGDVWKKPEEGKSDVKLGKGTFRVDVTDEESKLNINVASPGVLQSLLQQLGYEEEDAKLAAAAIMDWRDPDDKSSIEGTTDRLENGVYSVLFQGGDPTEEFRRLRNVEPVRLKNDAFTTIDELLDVYGITPDMFYGPGTPEARQAWKDMADKYQYLDRHGRRFQIRKTHSRFRDAQPVGLRDCVTVYSNGTLNINTAPREVLAALLRASGVNTTDPETIAGRIVEYRRDGTDRDISNNKAFRQVSELDSVGNFGAGVSAMGATYSLTVRSDHFTITSTGMSSRYQRTLRLVVYRTIETYQRDERFEDMHQEREARRRHQWKGLRSSKSDLKSGKLGPDERTVLWPAVRIMQWIEP